MLNHLLVVLETDKEDNDVLDHAVAVAQASGARITLLRLLNPSSQKSHFVDPFDWHMHKLEVEETLKKSGQKVGKKGVVVHTEVLESTRTGDLLQYAQAQAVDLLIFIKQTDRISEHTHNQIKRTTIPVLVVQGFGQHPTLPVAYRKILVPLDGSQRAEYDLSLVSQ
jgi:nucleotide-binding universal stress UspA family protein